MSKLGVFLAGNACILLATIFWGVNVAVTKDLIQEMWMSADGISAVRLIGGCALFWLCSLFGKNDAIARNDWIKIISGGVGLFLFIWLFVVSVRYGSAIDISIIMTLPPMFVILIGVVFLKQRPSWLEYMGVIISFVGAVIVIMGATGNGGGGSNHILGDLLGIGSCVCYAFYLIILQKPTHKYKSVSLLRWVFLFSAIPSFILVPGMEDMTILHTAEPLPWLEIGFILICPTFIAYFLVQPAIRDIGAELVSLYQYVLPVFAIITVVLMGLEALRMEQIAAMVVIVAGMVFTNVGKKRRLSAEHK